MDQEPSGKPPLPPQAFPPAPPPEAFLKPNASHIPLTPMMEFLQRRLEGLEKELTLERERAHSAQSLLQNQESLRSQVEEHLKAMTDGLRREKTERDNEETKSHARGRIDALEKRLDEMHQSWVTLLREAVSQRDSGQAVAQDSITRDLGALKLELTALIDQMGQWRAESRAMSEALPELRSLTSQLPADGRRFEGQVSQMLADFSAELRDRVSSWERRQSLEMEKHEERLQAFAREKSALLQALEEQNHQLRQDGLKERIHRETQSAEQIAELAKRLNELRVQAVDNKTTLARIADALSASPQAKDKIVAALEQEKLELVKALKERGDALQEFLGQRRETELALVETVSGLRRELDGANAKQQTLIGRCAELELQCARLSDGLESAKRLAQEREERRKALEDERDQIAKALLSEAERARLLVDERSRAEDAWAKKASDLQSRLSAEIDAKTGEAGATAELRARLATLSEHMARALEERDSAVNRHSNWDRERCELLKRLHEKEEMISMLNATFQKLLKPNS